MVYPVTEIVRGYTPCSINFVNACLSLRLTRNHRGTQSINRHRRKITSLPLAGVMTDSPFARIKEVSSSFLRVVDHSYTYTLKFFCAAQYQVLSSKCTSCINPVGCYRLLITFYSGPPIAEVKRQFANSRFEIFNSQSHLR